MSVKTINEKITRLVEMHKDEVAKLQHELKMCRADITDKVALVEEVERLKERIENGTAYTKEIEGKRDWLGREIARLKECAEMGLEANADKAKEIATKDKWLTDMLEQCDHEEANGGRESQIMYFVPKEWIELALAAQPQGGE